MLLAELLDSSRCSERCRSTALHLSQVKFHHGLNFISSLRHLAHLFFVTLHLSHKLILVPLNSVESQIIIYFDSTVTSLQSASLFSSAAVRTVTEFCVRYRLGLCQCALNNLLPSARGYKCVIWSMKVKYSIDWA